MKKYFIPIIATSLALSSCFQRNNRLEAVLDYSGGNRGELERCWHITPKTRQTA